MIDRASAGSSTSATTTVGPANSADAILTQAACEAILARTCFGHLSFIRARHAEVVPVRYAFVDGWVYFRADSRMRDVIRANPWLSLSVTECSAPSQVSSVIVRGGCYETHDTGSPDSDASALRGIRQLRDRTAVGPRQIGRVPRTSTVFRIHEDHVRGIRTLVPCPAGDRPYDASEREYLGADARDRTDAEDQRADNDGMAEPR